VSVGVNRFRQLLMGISHLTLMRFCDCDISVFVAMDGPRAEDVLNLLQDRLAIVTGGRDKRGGPILLFPVSPKRERVHGEDLRRLCHYLFSIPW